MKATLEFNLPEDNNEYKIASRAIDFYVDLTDISQQIRSFEKYGLGIDPPEEDQNVEEWCKGMSKLVHDIWSLSHKNTLDIE